ncbi:MAG: penicillin-binding protein 2, partial [Alphaproteobacteria bacterium]|nr:penicillin-binding protein 2 [Alphaproteobacteria bacterium]
MAFDIFHRRKMTIDGTQAQALEQARLRLVWVVTIMMMGYLAITLRMGDLCLLHHKDAMPPANGGAAGESPLRASIVDRNGNVLAVSLPMASVYADARMVGNPEKLAHDLVSLLPQQNYADLLKRLSSGKAFVWIQRYVTPKQEYAINALGDPAIRFQQEQKRIYPDANLAAQVIGYTDVDGNGIAGIEKFFNKRLIAGGAPLRLTLDMRVQYIMRHDLSAAIKKFHALDGIGLVMDADTGEVVAMVSLPDFDPNHVGDATGDEKFNRATLGVYEMGSTFKTFSIAAGLNSG